MEERDIRDAFTGRYLPIIYPEEKPFWEAARRHRLALQCCSDCGRAFFPIGPCCPFCFSNRVNWQEMCGRGAISNIVIYHKAWTPYYQDQIPYVVIQVELEEGPRLTTNLRGSNQLTVRIGTKVEALWEDVNENISLIQFRSIGGN